MRVALVCPYDLALPGGVQAQVLGLASHLATDDDVWVVGPGMPEGWDAVSVRSVGDAVVVPGNRSAVPVGLELETWRRTLTAVEDAEVVHVHEPLQPLVSLAALSVERPRVATFHADPPRWGRAVYRAAAPLAERWLSGAVRTAVSPVAAGALPRRWEPVEVIPNGLDVARYQLAVDRHPRRVVFVGRDDPRKGLDVLLAAWPQVRAASGDAELVVAGARRERATPGVRYLGRVPESEKIEVMASAAALVAPNLGGESFGMVVAEGMAAGCAVVASDLPAFRHVLGDTGRLVPPEEPQALAKAMAEVLGDPDTRRRLGDAARRRVARFDWGAVADRYRSAYRRGLEAGGPGRSPQ